MSKWIKCSDRMPDDNQKILAFNGEINAAFFRINSESKEYLFGSKTCPSGYRVLNEITHWMPLPEPPSA